MAYKPHKPYKPFTKIAMPNSFLPQKGNYRDLIAFKKAIAVRSDETICNIAITLIHQADVLLGKYLERIKKDFLEKGGIKEQMYKARKEWMKNN